MGLKRNFIYSSILTTSNYIFPLLTFPYISRVLGVSNIGIYGFVDSIINYFVLFSTMGIGTIGIREIASNKNESQKLSNTFSSLIALNAISTLIVLLFFFTAVAVIPQLSTHKEMLYIGSCKIIFNIFLIEWFFKGIENFKYITIRSIIIKVIYVVCIFIFVRQPTDYNIYYTLTIGIVVITAMYNWQYSKKHTRFSLKNIQLRKYLKPFLIFGIYAILTSMYTSFNVIFLGIVSNETQVGYYTTASKLYTILLGLFTAFTGVMLPRMSYLASTNNINLLKETAKKSFNILFTICFPLIIFSISFSKELIFLISGSGYEEAVLPMQITMPLVLIIGLEQILIIQVLMPLKKDNAILTNSIIGAIVGIALNFILVEKYQSVGSAIVWLSAEISILIAASFFVYNSIKISIPLTDIGKNVLSSIPYLAISIILTKSDLSIFPKLSIALGGYIIYFIVLQLTILKNQTIIDILYQLKNQLKK